MNCDEIPGKELSQEHLEGSRLFWRRIPQNRLEHSLHYWCILHLQLMSLLTLFSILISVISVNIYVCYRWRLSFLTFCNVDVCQNWCLTQLTFVNINICQCWNFSPLTFATIDGCYIWDIIPLTHSLFVMNSCIIIIFKLIKIFWQE